MAEFCQLAICHKRSILILADLYLDRTLFMYLETLVLKHLFLTKMAAVFILSILQVRYFTIYGAYFEYLVYLHECSWVDSRS